jgi:hypothetical protein
LDAINPNSSFVLWFELSGRTPFETSSRVFLIEFNGYVRVVEKYKDSANASRTTDKPTQR